MRQLSVMACASVFFTMAVDAANSLPKIESSTRANGVVAYQDENDEKQFYIYPERVPLVLGLTLSDPAVKYWGIAAPFRQQETEYGLWVPMVGGTISGMATITITPDQEVAIREAIKRDFKIDDPKLTNLDGETKSVSPVMAENSIGVGKDGDKVFPKDFRFGSSFNFAVGSPSSHTFASYVAQRYVDRPFVTPDSSFAVNLVANSQFRGAEWSVSCKADLAKVWKEVRQRYGGSGGYGWLGISADYQSIQQDLFRSKIIDCSLAEGDLAAKDKSEQLFQIAKDALESINDPDNEFFRFQPNPSAGAIDNPKQGPYLISINLAYSSASLKDVIHWEQKFEYKPTIVREMPVSLTLAVKCDVNTEHFFKELEVSQPCITQKKAKFFQQWAERENKLKQEKLEEIMSNPNLSVDQKKELVKFYRVATLSDSAFLVRSDSIKDADTKKILASSKPEYVFIGVSDDMWAELDRLVERGLTIKDALSELRSR